MCVFGGEGAGRGETHWKTEETLSQNPLRKEVDEVATDTLTPNLETRQQACHCLPGRRGPLWAGCWPVVSEPGWSRMSFRFLGSFA